MRVVYELSTIVELHRRGLWSQRRAWCELAHLLEAHAEAGGSDLGAALFHEAWLIARERPPSTWPDLIASAVTVGDWPAAPPHLAN